MENSLPIYNFKKHLDLCKTEASKGQYALLQNMYQKYTPENLRELDDEGLAASWLVQFHLHFDQLGGDVRNVTTNFEAIFKGRSAKLIVLRDLISHFEVEPMEAKEFALLGHALEMCTGETILSAGRKLSLRFAKVFERNYEQLGYKALGAFFKAVHDQFTFRPDELTKHIVAKCLSNQYQLPLALLLAFPAFRERMTSKMQVLRLEKTVIVVVEAFKQYLFNKILPKEALKWPLCLFVQLLEVARWDWVQDEKLKKLCFEHLEKVDSNHLEANYKLAALAVRSAHEALDRKDIDSAEQHFLEACEKNNEDFLSFAAAGKLALRKNKFKKAHAYFEQAAQLAPFEYISHQTKTLVSYIKQFEKRIDEFSAAAAILMKKILLDESVEVEYSNFTEKLQKYFAKNNGYVQKFNFLGDLKYWCELVQGRNLKRVDFLNNVRLRLAQVLETLKNELLFKATILVDKFPKLSDQELSHPLYKDKFLLQGEIFYESGDLEGYKVIYDEINKATDAKIFVLSPEESSGIEHNRAKLLSANLQIDEAKYALAKAMLLCPENEEIQSSIILLNDGMPLCTTDYIEKNEKDFTVQYVYALSLYKKEKVENAKEQFLKADPYDARVNYFLANLENDEKAYYFERALKISLVDPLAFTECHEIAEYFLNNNGREELLVNLVELFSHTEFPEDNSEDLVKILETLAEKVENVDVKEMATKRIQELDPEYDESESDFEDSEGQEELVRETI